MLRFSHRTALLVREAIGVGVLHLSGGGLGERLMHTQGHRGREVGSGKLPDMTYEVSGPEGDTHASRDRAGKSRPVLISLASRVYTGQGE